jgi:hypothetical protein
MEFKKLGQVLIATAVATTSFCAFSAAEDVKIGLSAKDLNKFGFASIKPKAEGPYEIKSGGLLGYVVEHLPNNQVKFASCSNFTFTLDFSLLAESKANCPQGSQNEGPWNVTSKYLAPLFKKNADSDSLIVHFQGADLDLSNQLLVKDKQTLASTKTGDLVGFAFTDEKGQKTLAIVTVPMR